jgi:acyl-CoA reductase-like NAD-dependent aldehyde dehydrogenase
MFKIKISSQRLGDEPECGYAIALHQDIDKIAFTGSVEVRILE